MSGTRRAVRLKRCAEKPLTISEYLEVDDSDVIFHVKQWQRSYDEILADLSRRFTARRLFKAIDLDMPATSEPVSRPHARA